MWIRVRFDIGWLDLWLGRLGCLVPGRRNLLESSVASHWANPNEMLPVLSVRSGFDLLLTALDLPNGSEILLTALTVADMPTIVGKHGLVAVPVDLEPNGFRPDLDALRQAITANSRVIVVAHLFGDRVPMELILQIAREHNLIVVEDCAQSFSGLQNQYHPDSDLAMFSFGPIKTSTALQGGILRVGDSQTIERMTALQNDYPVQSSLKFAFRLARYALLTIVSTRIVFGCLVRICNILNVDYDSLLNRSSRNFSDGDLFDSCGNDHRQVCCD